MNDGKRNQPDWLDQVQQFHSSADLGDADATRDPHAVGAALTAIADGMSPSDGFSDAVFKALDVFEQRERGLAHAHIAAKLVAELRAALPVEPSSPAPAFLESRTIEQWAEEAKQFKRQLQALHALMASGSAMAKPLVSTWLAEAQTKVCGAVEQHQFVVGKALAHVVECCPIERFLTVTSDEEGRCLAVTWQDEEHRILDVVWEYTGKPGGHRPGGGTRADAPQKG